MTDSPASSCPAPAGAPSSGSADEPPLTRTVLLRPLGPGDEQDYFRLFSDPDCNRFDDFSLLTATDLPEVVAHLAAPDPSAAEQEQAIVDARGSFVGVFTVTRCRGLLYLGYHVLAEHRGRGCATAAVSAWVERAPRDQLADLRLAIDPANHASMRVAERAGFRRYRSRVSGGKVEHVYRLGGVPAPAIAPLPSPGEALVAAAQRFRRRLRPRFA